MHPQSTEPQNFLVTFDPLAGVDPVKAPVTSTISQIGDRIQEAFEAIDITVGAINIDLTAGTVEVEDTDGDVIERARIEGPSDYWLTLADDLRQAAERIATLAGTPAPAWTHLAIVGAAPQNATEASAKVIDAVADAFGTKAYTSDGGDTRRHGADVRLGAAKIQAYTYMPPEQSELEKLRARNAELEAQLAKGGASAATPANPDRRCHRCGATSGLRLIPGNPLTLADREWQCVDQCPGGAAHQGAAGDPIDRRDPGSDLWRCPVCHHEAEHLIEAGCNAAPANDTLGIGTCGCKYVAGGAR